MTASTIPSLSVWPCGTPWRGAQGGSDIHQSVPITYPSVRPNHLADPLRRRALGRASAMGEGFRIPNRSPEPWYDGRGEIIPFRYLPVLLEGKGMSHIGWGTGDLPGSFSQGEKLRVEPHPSQVRERALLGNSRPCSALRFSGTTLPLRDSTASSLSLTQLLAHSLPILLSLSL